MLCVCDIGLVACCVAERGHGRSGRSRHEGVPRPKGGCVTRGRVVVLLYPLDDFSFFAMLGMSGMACA